MLLTLGIKEGGRSRLHIITSKDCTALLLYVIEYDFRDANGPSTLPPKVLLVFNAAHKFIGSIRGELIRAQQIFPKQPPFLITYWTSYHGNGFHELWRIKSDTLTAAFDGSNLKGPGSLQTVMFGKEYTTLYPPIFPLKVEDENKDGLNDLVFNGYMEYRPNRSVVKVDTLKYTLLYNPLKEEFEPDTTTKRRFVRY